MKEKLVTIPNIITLSRLILIPFFIFNLVNNKTEIAIIIFAAIALSDALDGISARIMKQKTRIGALLDSTTDWLVFLSTLITFIIIKKYISFNIIIILIIAMGVSYLAKIIYVKKKKKTAPTIIGKITIAFAYITVIALLIDFKYKNLFLITIIALTYATMLNYIVKDVKLYIK